MLVVSPPVQAQLPVDANTQLARILPLVEKLCTEFDVIVSVDTSEADVIRAVDSAGAAYD